MSENPFFELVGALSYSHEDKWSRIVTEFESFSLKFDKHYMNEEELSERQSLFGRNIR